MKKENSVFENRFCEKAFVNVSICKSNIKSKKNTYYARVCKTGRVQTEELLSRLKSEAPYIDINMMRAGMEKMVDIIFNFVANGKSVDFFNLGSFSLASEGKIEVESSMHRYLNDEESESDVFLAAHNADVETMQDGTNRVATFSDESDTNSALKAEKSFIEKENADFDISEAILTQPKFSLKFEVSIACKKACANVKMALALKKRRSPVIEKIERVFSAPSKSPISILKVKGDNLKIVGENEKIGVYIKEENGERIKIDSENIIQNTPKMLLILLNSRLKKDASYTLSLFTQYASMGSTSTTSLLRMVSSTFIWNEEGTCCLECKNYLQEENCAKYKKKRQKRMSLIYNKERSFNVKKMQKIGSMFDIKQGDEAIAS